MRFDADVRAIASDQWSDMNTATGTMKGSNRLDAVIPIMHILRTWAADPAEAMQMGNKSIQYRPIVEVRGAMVICLSALSLSLPAMTAHAAVTFSGWNAGTSASSFSWSTDLYDPTRLGLPDLACVYAGASNTCADSRYPHGTTTPANLPTFSAIAGQQVQTQVQRSIVTSNDMSASMTADVQRAGDIEGQVTHIRFENEVSSLAVFGYGLFTHSDARGLLSFGGIGAQTPLYYYMEWVLDTEATDGGARMSYGLELFGNDPSLRGNNLPTQDLRGSRAGYITGVSALSPQFAFGLSTPAGVATQQTRATGSLDIWLTFSSSPVSSVPAPAPWQMWLGAGLVSALIHRWRRRWVSTAANLAALR